MKPCNKCKLRPRVRKGNCTSYCEVCYGRRVKTTTQRSGTRYLSSLADAYRPKSQ